MYFCCHPEDFNDYFDLISDEILSVENCAIWYSDEFVERDEIFYDTMSDIKIWINDHKARTGEDGVFELHWLIHHMNMSIFKIGRLISFIPSSVIMGFTSGIAVTIVIGQIKDFLGLTFPEGMPTVETAEKVEAIAKSITTFNPQALLVGAIGGILLPEGHGLVDQLLLVALAEIDLHGHEGAVFLQNGL